MKLCVHNIKLQVILICFSSLLLIISLHGKDFDLLLSQTVEGKLCYAIRTIDGDKIQFLYWETVEGSTELIHRWPCYSNGGTDRPDAGIRDGDLVAMVTGSSFGDSTYRRFKKTSDGWVKDVESPLGVIFAGSRGIEFNNSTTFILKKSEGVGEYFEVTDQPLVPGSNGPERLALINGEPFQPRGVYFSGWVFGEPPIRKTGEQAAIEHTLASKAIAAPTPSPSPDVPAQSLATVQGDSRWQLAIPLILVWASAAGLVFLWLKRLRSS